MRILLFFSFVFFLSSCDKDQLSPVEYVKWVKSNKSGLITEKVVGEYAFTLSYLPVDYRLIKEVGLDSIFFKETEILREELNKQDYFLFRMSNKNKTKNMLKTALSSPSEFQSRVNYFSFYSVEDFELVSSESLSCSFFHLERAYGLTPYDTFILSFPKSDDNKDKTVVYHDKILGVGPIKLTINKKYIKNIPDLKI